MVLNFVKSCFNIYLDDHIGFILQLVDVLCHIDWFTDVEKALHSWDKSLWSWCMTFLVYCRYRLLVFCWGILHLYSSVILSCNFHFLRYLCLILVSEWWLAHKMSWNFPSSESFSNSFRRVSVDTSLKVW